MDEKEKCGQPYYAYAYTPEGESDTITEYCENQVPCPEHDTPPRGTDAPVPTKKETDSKP